MKKMLVLTMVTVMSLTGVATTASANPDALVEQVLLLNMAEELDLLEYELMEVLQGYKMYRQQMDNLTTQRDETQAEVSAALAADDDSFGYAAATRQLMDLDMRILRLLQSSVNEAADVMPAAAVAQLYLSASDMDKARADLIATLSGATCPLPCIAEAISPMAAPAVAAEAVSPEEAVLEQALVFLSQLAEKEIDVAMKAVADDFEHFEYGDKEDLGFFLEQAMYMGYLDDIEIITTDTEVKIDGDKAIIYPLDIAGMFGSATLELICEKRDGEWMLTGMDAIGL